MTHRPATLDDYRWLYAHGYMPDGLKCAREIMPDITDRCPATFLDYGCGRGDLVRWINEKTRGHAIGWDPASIEPFPECQPDWIVSCDVLEHIAPADLYGTLSELRPRYGFLFTIANMNDIRTINSERVQLHLIREPAEWWIDRMREHWPTAHIKHREINQNRFVLIVEFA
jgi:SAM-dependent methyltransferase